MLHDSVIRIGKVRARRGREGRQCQQSKKAQAECLSGGRYQASRKRPKALEVSWVLNHCYFPSVFKFCLKNCHTVKPTSVFFWHTNLKMNTCNLCTHSQNTEQFHHPQNPLVLFLSGQILEECLGAEETCLLPRQGSVGLWEECSVAPGLL